jgi:hypothetical protein
MSAARSRPGTRIFREGDYTGPINAFLMLTAVTKW